MPLKSRLSPCLVSGSARDRRETGEDEATKRETETKGDRDGEGRVGRRGSDSCRAKKNKTLVGRNDG